MKKRKIFGIIGLYTSVILFGLLMNTVMTSCTKNERVKRFGGSMTIELKENQKFVNVTWKADEMWILTRDAHEGDIQENYTFQEKSKYGIIEGTVYIKENIVTNEMKLEKTGYTVQTFRIGD